MVAKGENGLIIINLCFSHPLTSLSQGMGVRINGLRIGILLRQLSGQHCRQLCPGRTTLPESDPCTPKLIPTGRKGLIREVATLQDPPQRWLAFATPKPSELEGQLSVAMATAINSSWTQALFQLFPRAGEKSDTDKMMFRHSWSFHDIQLFVSQFVLKVKSYYPLSLSWPIEMNWAPRAISWFLSHFYLIIATFDI